MQAAQESPYSFTAVSAGVDWITATAKGKAARKLFEAQGEAILQEEAAAGVEISSGGLRDYVGWQAPSVFIGSRRDDSLIRLSSTHAAHHWKTVAQHATNVSRLDLQVTVFTHGEQPNLARYYCQKLRRLPAQRGRPRKLRLIQEFPHGETLYVNKRVSDYFGRCYDYATAHKKGPPRTLWRFEVEIKRHYALHHSRALLAADDPRGHAETTVARWWQTRGVLVPWVGLESPHSADDRIEREESDVLLWFRSSLSKTVAKAIKSHGAAAVLEALQLSRYVITSPRKE